jgi:hypothetical protein
MYTLVPVTVPAKVADESSFVKTIGQYQTFDSRPLPNPDGERKSNMHCSYGLYTDMLRGLQWTRCGYQSGRT